MNDIHDVVALIIMYCKIEQKHEDINDHVTCKEPLSALQFGAPFIIAVFMGMVTATGGGVIRALITDTTPKIMSGQLYATAAFLGSINCASLRYAGIVEIPAELVACLAAFSLRAAAIVFDIRMAPPASLSESARQTITKGQITKRKYFQKTSQPIQSVRKK